MVSVSSLLLPPSMKDFASCLGDGAVRVADISTCTTPSSTLTHSPSPSPSTVSLTSCYRALLRDHVLLLSLTWSLTPLGPSLSFSPSAHSAPSLLLRKRKGTRSFHDHSALPVAIFWDLTAANYSSSSTPEPLSGFYFVAVADAHVALALGDLAADFIKAKFDGQIPRARFSPLSRRERVVAAAAAREAAMHTTRVRFADGAPEHEISVGCTSCGGGVGGGEELWVCVDGKRAVQARRLRWNFRGNQTVFVDGAPVDFMWDLHAWLFREPPGCAVFLLRARSALESRLWLEEEAAAPGFSLVVQAFKTPP